MTAECHSWQNRRNRDIALHLRLSYDLVSWLHFLGDFFRNFFAVAIGHAVNRSDTKLAGRKPFPTNHGLARIAFESELGRRHDGHTVHLTTDTTHRIPFTIGIIVHI